jgi:hypothetical protein
LHHLQLGGEALRPDGLLRIVLPSFILFAEKLANELLGAFRDTREGGPSESAESEEVAASSLYRG